MTPTNLQPAQAASPTAALIEVKNLGVKSGERWLIRDVNFTISRGEIVTLVGPNGGGKSTTVKALLNLVDIDAGSVIRSDDLRIGYVPQRFVVDQTLPLSVSRFMQLTHRFSNSEIAKHLARTGVATLVEAQLSNLSGGELQRVLLARAIAARPQLLVLDEPVQGVDIQGELALYELIADIRDELQCGILLVSHDLHIVMAKTDHVICLNGHICCHGTPSAVRNDAAYKDLFGYAGSDVVSVYHHQHDHAHDVHGEHIPIDTGHSDEEDH